MINIAYYYKKILKQCKKDKEQKNISIFNQEI